MELCGLVVNVVWKMGGQISPSAENVDLVVV